MADINLTPALPAPPEGLTGRNLPVPLEVYRPAGAFPEIEAGARVWLTR